MKAEHLKKISQRAERALGLLLPWETHRGEITDPKKRLADIIVRVDGSDRNSQLANDIWALTELLETNIPELIQAVRNAQEEARQARRELAARAGTRYRITITSSTPLGVESMEVTEPEADNGETEQQAV